MLAVRRSVAASFERPRVVGWILLEASPVTGLYIVHVSLSFRHASHRCTVPPRYYVAGAINVRESVARWRHAPKTIIGGGGTVVTMVTGVVTVGTIGAVGKSLRPHEL